MNVNAVADAIAVYIKTKHPRVYLNKSPQNRVFPYVVYRVDGVINTVPSDDMYINIDIYDDVNVSVRGMEDLADLIDNDLNLTVIDTDVLNMHFDREQRQYIPVVELLTTHLINLRYTVRVYFK